MHRHGHFDLWLHDDDELGRLVQSNIVERVTLHEWPLSCVQRLALADGRKLIYKTQFGPTVESEFYANAKSDLLPWAQTIAKFDGYVGMLFEHVRAPLLENLDLPEEEAARIGRSVLAQITEITGQLPYYLDVSSESKWRAFAHTLLKRLRGLIAQEKFTRTDETVARDLERWVFSESVLSVIRTRPGCVHCDLSGDNVFAVPDGYRVIDWQRPILGPTDLDMAELLASLGFDPLPHVGAGVVRILYLLKIDWFTRCAARWFPAGVHTYDGQIAEFAARLDDSTMR